MIIFARISYQETESGHLKILQSSLIRSTLRPLKKLATMKSIPYQALIRNWLAEEIKKELDTVRR